MANKQRYTAAQVVDAVLQAHGNLTAAATVLGCSRETVANYQRRYVTVQQAVQQGREAIVDLCENKSVSLINQGYWPAIKYWLATQGRDRGFGPDAEQDIKVEFVVKYEDDQEPDHTEDSA
jgi:hypothetical protein